MDSRNRRLNEERFSRTAEVFASSQAVGKLTEIDSLLRLAAPSPTDLLLDVACGAGRLLGTFAPLVRMAVGADVTMEMLRLARRPREAGGQQPREGGAGILVLVRAAGERLPFRDGTFTIVTATLALHHFGTPRRVLDEMVRVCRPGGKIAVGDIVGSSDDVKRARQNEIERLRDPSHVEVYSPSGIEALLTSCGLTVTGREGGAQVREFNEWCRVAATPPDVVPRVQEMLLRTEKGDQAGMQPALVGYELRFLHHWLNLVATKR